MSPENYDRVLLAMLYVGITAIAAVLAIGLTR